MSKKIKDIKISLEIGDNFIKLAELRPFRNKHILRLAAKKLSSKEDIYISREISGLFSSLNIPKKEVLISFPRHLAMARFFRLPSVNDDEVKEMARMEFLKQLPSSEEVISGHRTVEKFKNGYSKVFTAVAQAQSINRLVNISKGAGLVIEKIALSSECLFFWYSLISSGKASEALVNIDSEYIDIDIMEKGNLAFTRAFSNNGDTRITVAEIKKTVATYQKESRTNVDKMIISGANNKIKEIESILRQELSMPIEIIGQIKNIELDKTVGADLNELSFINLIGLSFKDKDAEINLLPEYIRQDNEFRVLKRNFIKTAVLIAAMSLIFFGIIMKKLSDKSHYLYLLNSEISRMEPSVAMARRMKEDIGIIKQDLEKRPLAIDVVSEIYRITPQNIIFNYLDYQSDKSVVLRGSAAALQDVIKYISLLEGSGYFENVKIKYTTKRVIANKETIDFEVIAGLSRQ